MKRLLLLLFLAAPAAAREGREFSLTILPNAAIRFRGEGKVIPQSYMDHFDGETSPVYRLDWRQGRAEDGYWGFSLLHSGYFGGGSYAGETVPDLTTGGTYQTDRMNVGFTNVQLTYRRPLAAFPQVEGLAEVTVAREIFKRARFVVLGVPGDNINSVGDDVDETSAEGVGVGMAGRHPLASAGNLSLYGRWEFAASHMFQIFDARTDASAGQIFRSEAALGVGIGEKWSLEVGGMWYYWFLFSQGNRRLFVPGAAGGAVISWNRKETRFSGLLVSLRRTF